MTITLPKGYTPPEGSKPGEPFEAVAMLVASEDGSYTLKTIDGVKIAGYKDHEEKSEDMEPEQPSPFDFPEYANPAQQPTF